jgi:hypothetical protein
MVLVGSWVPALGRGHYRRRLVALARQRALYLVTEVLADTPGRPEARVVSCRPRGVIAPGTMNFDTKWSINFVGDGLRMLSIRTGGGERVMPFAHESV